MGTYRYSINSICKTRTFLTPKNATGYGVRLLNELIKNNYEK